MKNNKSEQHQRQFLVISWSLWLVFVWGLINWAQAVNGLGFFVVSWKWRLGLGAWIGLAILWVGLLITSYFQDATPSLWLRQTLRGWIVRIGGSVVALGFIAFPAVALSGWLPHPEVWEPFPTRLMLLCVSIFFGGMGISLVTKDEIGWLGWVASALGVGVGLILLQYLPGISSYPLSLGWSEASRYYYGSLFFAKRIYGVSVPLSPLHPARYLLLAIPFAFGNLPIWAHRFWQVILWLGLSFLASVALVRRLRIENRFVRFLAIIWGALFLLQGPVYYHLTLCVIPVLLFFDIQKPWRTLAVVVISSLWAGICRVNWFPVPGALAILLYILENPIGKQPFYWYYKWPFIFGTFGMVAAFAAQAVYIALSGQPSWMYESTFTSDLLWYRLFPSPTYPVGIIRGIVWVSLPLWIMIGFNGFRNFAKIRVWRWLGIVAILGVFFAGGMVVSVKIGGGSNIHNLDAYLVFLMLLGAYLATHRIIADRDSLQIWRPVPILLLVAIMPVGWHMYFAHPIMKPDEKIAWQDVEILRDWTQRATAQGGRVLFINQRHLLTFGIVRGVPLEPEYELLVLMEMAMANNSRYLNRFYNDLQHHRFDVIVIGTPNTPIKDPTKDAFAEENNAWVERVVLPLLQNYKVALILPSDVALMVPRTEDGADSP
jgi:hypothetical protein